MEAEINDKSLTGIVPVLAADTRINCSVYDW
jgi:hypothetical protein